MTSTFMIRSLRGLAAAGLLSVAVATSAQPAPVVSGSARFTVLTPRVIRMEYSPDGTFVDAASLVFTTRSGVQAPPARVSHANGTLTIETEALSLRYKEGSGAFTSDNLSITSRQLTPAFRWTPGTQDSANLGGTARTLDAVDGDKHIEDGKPLDLGQGLLSRSGWSVVDDTGSYLLDTSPLPWVIKRSCTTCTDMTFFGYGHDYKAALKDFSDLAGKEPLPPRYAFGYWWSRYWNYSDDELRQLVSDFDLYRIPIDVLVIDMDWHRTDGLSSIHPARDSAGQDKGWTGFTWNRSLFPDPKRLLSWLQRSGLRVTLNLHPASGVLPHEAAYVPFMEAAHADPARPLPFEAADANYMSALFKTVLDPLTASGVTFWWLDWQQWRNSKLFPDLSNTWWLNHVFFEHMRDAGQGRALIYHRWGGLGNHRYQVGFSGDSIISWASLAFQPSFTATASNVLYGYWSHDLGGHMFRDESVPEQLHVDPELYVRWMQFGAYSPIMRTHAGKYASLRKEPWRFAPAEFAALRGSILTRYSLLPYVYTMGREAYDTGESIVRPMYYGWPDQATAYQVPSQYMFGDDLLVAPITAAADADGFAWTTVWLPPGAWFDTVHGKRLTGGSTVRVRYRLDEVPVFARAGAIVPTATHPSLNTSKDDGERSLRVYPGASGKASLYDDAGNDEGYRTGAYATVPLSSHGDAHGMQLTIGPRKGQYPGMPTSRTWHVEVIASALPSRVRVDGVELARHAEGDAGAGWRLRGNDLTLVVDLPEHGYDTPQTVDVDYPASAPGVDGLPGQLRDAREAVTWLKSHWMDNSALPDDISLMGQTGLLIDNDPDKTATLLAHFRQTLAGSDALLKADEVPADTRAAFHKRLTAEAGKAP
jgi:alpha-glucosidase (family GH31 glycosyl hydrolase)